MQRTRRYNLNAWCIDDHVHCWELLGSEGFAIEEPILGCSYCGLVFTPEDYKELKKAFTDNLPTGI